MPENRSTTAGQGAWSTIAALCAMQPSNNHSLSCTWHGQLVEDHGQQVLCYKVKCVTGLAFAFLEAAGLVKCHHESKGQACNTLQSALCSIQRPASEDEFCPGVQGKVRHQGFGSKRHSMYGSVTITAHVPLDRPTPGNRERTVQEDTCV